MPEYPGVYVEEVVYRPAIPRIGADSVALIADFATGPELTPIPIHTALDLTVLGGSDTLAGRSIIHALGNGATSVTAIRLGTRPIPDALQLIPEDIGLLLMPDAALRRGISDIQVAQQWAEARGALYLIDPPDLADVAHLRDWMAATPLLGSPSSAVFFPWVVDDHGATTPPGGAVAGVIARTDRTAGVWKAPAGVEAELAGVMDLAASITQSEADGLTLLSVNPLQKVGANPVVWGARTLSSDPEWKYIPTRRLATLIETSVYRGTQWAVFEPNNQSLWDGVRWLIEGFLTDLWRSGAFQGAKPDDAFFVRCGSATTMTQSDIQAGRLIVEIGFAPLRPAEFLIMNIVHEGLPTTTPRTNPVTWLVARAAAATTGGNTPALLVGGTRAKRLAAVNGAAGRLGKKLFRVDVRHCISAHITEKNLRAVFTAADEADAVLLFDEADALFGKRSTGHDSHDRDANMEVSYLMELVDKHPGFVALSAQSRPRMRAHVEVLDLDERPAPPPRVRRRRRNPDR